MYHPICGICNKPVEEVVLHNDIGCRRIIITVYCHDAEEQFSITYDAIEERLDSYSSIVFKQKENKPIIITKQSVSISEKNNTTRRIRM